MIRPEHTRRAPNGMVCSIDHLASSAGVQMLVAGGNAVDAAVATSAVLAVTSQHMCGMGGDLWALVHEGGDQPPVALNASGRAGSGSDAAALRDEGFELMPFRGDLRTVPVPGCVDGWSALHERFGSLRLDDILAPAIGLAEDGFPVSPILANMIDGVADVEGNDDYMPDGKPAVAGQLIRRPGVARSLEAFAAEGPAGWYQGEFGEALRRMGEQYGGLYSEADLATSRADWVEPTRADAWGHTLWTVPPNSQGYISLAAAVIADGLELPEDPDDPLWAHLLVESAKQASFDRRTALFEGADGQELVSEERMGPRRSSIDPDRASELAPPGAGGGTIYLSAVDHNRMGVSLMQSNAAGFGSHLAVPEVGVFLQNRGYGFSLEEGHPAELQPGRRPPSTLAPALISNPDGTLRNVLGTMGGDGQPQVVLQMMARLLHAGMDPGQVISASRFTLTVPRALGFDTWDRQDELIVAIEEGNNWSDGLAERGHNLREDRWGLGLYGHAHMIDVAADHLAGAADPRALIGSALGW